MGGHAGVSVPKDFKSGLMVSTVRRNALFGLLVLSIHLAGFNDVSAGERADPTVCLLPGERTVPRTVQLLSIGRGGSLLLASSVSPDRPSAYRLADIVAMKHNDDGFGSRLLKKGRIFSAFQTGKKDRYNRRAVHLLGDGTVWVQAALLSAGHALVLPRPGISAQCLAALRKAEAEAERKRAGLWSDSSFVFNASQLRALYEKRGQFVIVQGTVLSVGDRTRRVYLNFGETWSKDFTINLAKSGRGAFKGDMARILASRGKMLRVRGVLDWSGGPLIRVLNEGQIEFVDP